MSLSAEIAYLFRHAVMRDAAYDLLPPTARGALHGIALEIMERLCAAAPEVNRDAWAEELADHALRASEEPGADLEALRSQELRHLQCAAAYEAGLWHNDRAVMLRQRIAEHPQVEDAGSVLISSTCCA